MYADDPNNGLTLWQQVAAIAGAFVSALFGGHALGKARSVRNVQLDEKGREFIEERLDQAFGDKIRKRVTHEFLNSPEISDMGDRLREIELQIAGLPRQRDIANIVAVELARRSMGD